MHQVCVPLSISPDLLAAQRRARLLYTAEADGLALPRHWFWQGRQQSAIR